MPIMEDKPENNGFSGKNKKNINILFLENIFYFYPLK